MSVQPVGCHKIAAIWQDLHLILVLFCATELGATGPGEICRRVARQLASP
jgi:hypothetical protein